MSFPSYFDTSLWSRNIHFYNPTICQSKKFKKKPLQKKKISGVTIPKFKEVPKPDTIAWQSIQSGAKGAQVIVIVYDKSVTIYALSTGEDQSMQVL